MSAVRLSRGVRGAGPRAAESRAPRRAPRLPGRSPLGALPALSPVARRALVQVAGLSLVNTVLLVVQAFLLAAMLASIVDGSVADGVALWWLAGVVAGRGLVSWANRVVAARAAAGVKRDLRARVVDHALVLGPEWIAARGTGELGVLSTRGLDALDAYFTEYLPALVSACVVPPVIGAAVLWADWPSAVVLLVTVPLLPVFGALIGMHTADQVRASMDATGRLAGHLLELVRALPVLVAFRRARAQSEAVRRVSERHRKASIGTLKLAFASAFALELIATLSVALVAVLIGVRLVSGDLALAIGLGVLLLVPDCYQALRSVGTAFHASEDGVEAVRRVAEVLAEDAGVAGTSGATDAVAAGTSGAAESVPAPRPSLVRVRDLRVRRRGGFAPDGESFETRPGEVTWLRSPSGAGKSSTLGVLLGFVRAESGMVTVGDRDLRELDRDAWRRAIAWVPQFPALPGHTVREVLESAAPKRDVRPVYLDIVAVAAELEIADLLERDPEELSIGQRQRVAVARALLRVRLGAWLLLLDEPTAHLDEHNAALVMRAVHAAAAGGVAVVIAAHHRAEGLDLSPSAPQAPSTPVAEMSTYSAGPLAVRSLVGKRLVGGAVLGALALLCGVALAGTSGWLIARASLQPPILTLTVAIVGVRTFGLGRAGLRYLERLATHDAAFRIATGLRVRLWRALVERGPVASLSPGAVAERQRGLVDDIDTVRDLVPRVLTPPVVAVLVAIGAVAVQTLLLPSAGGVLLAAVLLGGAGALFAQFHVERRATALLSDRRRTVHARALALYEGAAELLAYGGVQERRSELERLDDELTVLARRAALGDGVANGLVVVACGIAALLSTWLATGAVAAGVLEPVLAVPLALVPLALVEVLALVPPVAVHASALNAARSRLGAVLGELSGDSAPELGGDRCRELDNDALRLDGVTVSWPGAHLPTLRNVDLRVPAGAHVAVIGPSGAGKSTLLATILGFLRPEHGTVRVRGQVIWAPQDPALVSTTLAENLRLADPHATDAELADALRAVHLPELAERLDTVLGSAGAGLSGGQARRVSLARAVLAARRASEPAVILLDEPTAHLDADTAQRVLTGLRTVLDGHTLVQVTHSAQDAAQADVMLEVRGGRVHERVAAVR